MDIPSSIVQHTVRQWTAGPVAKAFLLVELDMKDLLNNRTVTSLKTNTQESARDLCVKPRADQWTPKGQRHDLDILVARVHQLGQRRVIQKLPEGR